MTDVTSRRPTSYRIIIFYLYFWHKDVLGLFWHNKALGSAKNNAWVKPATIANKNFMKKLPDICQYSNSTTLNNIKFCDGFEVL